MSLSGFCVKVIPILQNELGSTLLPISSERSYRIDIIFSSVVWQNSSMNVSGFGAFSFGRFLIID